MTLALVTDGVIVVRRGVAVLRDVALEVPAGAVACVEGPNGSGKTSLLRVLAGIAVPAAGRVDRAGACAFVPERVALAPRVPAIAWLRAMDRMRGARREWPTEARTWGLDDEALARPVARLSKGGLQRLVLCEALTAPVGVLVLDEPWSGLDAQAREVLAGVLRARAGAGAAVVLTDHSGARHGRLRAGAAWRLHDGRLLPSHDSGRGVAVTASRDGERIDRVVPAGAHDALLAELLRDGWSIEAVTRR